MSSTLSRQEARAKREGKNRVQQIHGGKMLLVNPIDVIVALLHQVVAPASSLPWWLVPPLSNLCSNTIGFGPFKP
jgi:hypothetical protein